MDTTIARFLIEDRLAELRRAADDERLIRSARAASGTAEASLAILPAPGAPVCPTAQRR